MSCVESWVRLKKNVRRYVVVRLIGWAILWVPEGDVHTLSGLWVANEATGIDVQGTS